MHDKLSVVNVNHLHRIGVIIAMIVIFFSAQIPSPCTCGLPFTLLTSQKKNIWFLPFSHLFGFSNDSQM